MAPPESAQLDTAGGGKWERSIKQWLSERLKSTEGESRRALEYGQKFIAAVVTGIGRLFLVLMVAAFILVDLTRIQGFLRSLVPEQYQGDYDQIVEGIDRGLSGVIRGQLLICLINGVLTYIGLLIFKVKYALLLAASPRLMSLVPIFGSILSSIPIVAIALVSSGSFDLEQGVAVLAWIIGIHLVEANFLNPKIMGDAAKIHPVLVVFALHRGRAQLRPGRARCSRCRSRRSSRRSSSTTAPARGRAARGPVADHHRFGVRRQSGASCGIRSGPAINAERAGTSRQPGRAAPSREASMTSARSDSWRTRRPPRWPSLRSSRAWHTGQSEIPSTSR